jgi:hypothetical protein
MEIKFFASAGRNDLDGMRKELHKVEPIVFNLRFTRMLAVIEKYHEDKDISDKWMSTLNEEVKNCLAEIYSFLETY